MSETELSAIPPIGTQEQIHKKLLDYILSNKYEQFKAALPSVDLNYSEGDKSSIYEQLLSTKRENRIHFLKLCIDSQCSVNYVNPRLQKAAVNYAAESLSFCNMFVLLFSSQAGEAVVNVDHKYNDQTVLNFIAKVLYASNAAVINVNHKYNGQTALNYLAKALNASNAGEVGECMELLLRNGASINTTDDEGMTPLNYVLQNKQLPKNDRYNLTYMLLLRATSVSKHVTEAWFYIQSNHIDRHNELGRKSINEMIRYQNTFLEQKAPFLKRRLSDLYSKKYSDRLNYLIALLHRYVKREDSNALKCLMQTFIINTDDENMEIILKAMSFRNVQTVAQLLESRHIKLPYHTSVELLEKAINNMPSKSEGFAEFHNYLVGFRHLLRSRHVDISGIHPDFIPPLYYAVLVCNETAVKELLSSGAYMGMNSNYAESLVSLIRPEILEEHFNSCITIDNEHSKDSNIDIDLSNVSHPPKINDIPFVYNDMTTIAQIRKSKELYHLLQHPVITLLLVIKWQMFSKFFYIHFAIYSLFQLFITTLILKRFPNRTTVSSSLIIQVLCLILILYLLVREVIQFVLSWKHYLRSFIVNLLDLLVIVLTICTCIEYGTEETQSIVATFTLLLTSFKFLLLMSSLRFSWISMPLLMLIEVSRTVMKYVLVFVFLVLTFGACFHIRFANPIQSEETSNATESLNLNFDSFILSSIKSYVMSTGEYDASSIEIKSYFDLLLLVLFVIIVGISFFNLLTGLAVSDIQMIKDQAAIYRTISHINLLSTCEDFLNHPLWDRWIFKRLKYYINPLDNPVHKISIPQYQYPHLMTLHYYKSNEDDLSDTNSPAQASNIANLQHIAEAVKTSYLPVNQKDEMDVEMGEDISGAQKMQGRWRAWSKIKELAIKLFLTNSYLIDDVTFHRALKIAKKETGERTWPDLGTRMHELERTMNTVLSQNESIKQLIAFFQNNVMENPTNL